jgi:hypothetical protein
MKSCKLISNFLCKKNMFILKQVHVHWVNLIKKIISKFDKLEIFNPMVARENIHFFYQFASCLYSLNSKKLTPSTCHMCRK